MFFFSFIDRRTHDLKECALCMLQSSMWWVSRRTHYLL